VNGLSNPQDLKPKKYPL